MRNAPEYVQFYPTLRCNQSCTFCFNKSMPLVPDMTLPDVRCMIGRLKDIGIGTLDVMGGEPTMHAGLASILECAGHAGMAVNLSSNGTDVCLLSEIMERFPDIAVGVSVNDRAALARVEAFIRLRKPIVKSVFGLPLDAELISAILGLHPKRFYLLYRDALDRPELRSTVPFEQYRKIARGTFNYSEVGMVYCSGFLPDEEHFPELLHVRCPAGTTKLGIMPDGSVYPCNLFFGRDGFRLGNMLTDPFEKIWRHPSLAFFRTFAGNACPRSSCTLHGICHGGCPAHSYIHGGTLDTPDPRCVPRAAE